MGFDRISNYSKTRIIKCKLDAISKISPGVLAEAAIKLALWELYSDIRAGYQEDPQFSTNKTAKYIYDEMFKSLPASVKSGNTLKSKYQPVFLDLLNPSLNFIKKREAFSKFKKVDAKTQKLFFEKWYSIVNQIVEERSEKYFNILCAKKYFFPEHYWQWEKVVVLLGYSMNMKK